MIWVSLLIHIALIIFLSLNPWPTIIRVRPTAYTVTLIPISIPEPEIAKTPPPPIKEERSKPIEKPKKDALVEKVKKPEKEKPSLKNLHEAIEEIRRKAALDQIQKNVARRKEERPPVAPPEVPVTSPIQTQAVVESKLNEYFSLIWAKIKKAWIIPENLLKEKVDLETIIIIIIERDGKVQKAWFEKRSGNDRYDQMAMRAIKRAEPLPPIPKELNENILEIGIRFLPD